MQNLHCGYPGHVVLKGLSFDVAPGEFMGILGPNGSGKTTLVLALSGVLPILEGCITLSGALLHESKPVHRARQVAVVAQDGQVRFPFTCEEVVTMGRYPHRKRWQMESLQDAERVEWAMERTDTRVLADRLVTAISGGERQRVMMARALAQETPILLLDESTSAMDVHRKLQVFKLLEELSLQHGMTILAVLHDINLAALFCRRLMFLKDGQVVADGPSESVLTPGILEEVYQAKVLVSEIEHLGKRQVIFLPY